jgi:hypothetical protein
MPMQKATQVVLASRPATPRASLENFRLEEIPMPVAGPGEVLLRVDYLSLDPYMRGRMNDRKSYAKPADIDQPMPGESVATVLESNAAELAKGDVVLVQSGWRSHLAADAAGLTKLELNGVPESAYLGVLGMPGFTAYSGLAAIGKPKAGETLVVGAASGPVGSLVGQLAKQAGARSVGIAGGPKKCAYLLETLGFDAAIDHLECRRTAAQPVRPRTGLRTHGADIGQRKRARPERRPLSCDDARCPDPQPADSRLHQLRIYRAVSRAIPEGRRRPSPRWQDQASGRHHRWPRKRATSVPRHDRRKEFRQGASAGSEGLGMRPFVP